MFSTAEADYSDLPFVFPYRLHKVVSDAELMGYQHIISWMPCGTMFKVHHVEAFATYILPRICRHSKYKSFLRQLSMYKFRRTTSGPNQGAYSHSYFKKHRQDLCRGIIRGDKYLIPTTTTATVDDAEKKGTATVNKKTCSGRNANRSRVVKKKKISLKNTGKPKLVASDADDAVSPVLRKSGAEKAAGHTPKSSSSAISRAAADIEPVPSSITTTTTTSTKMIEPLCLTDYCEEYILRECQKSDDNNMFFQLPLFQSSYHTLLPPDDILNEIVVTFANGKGGGGDDDEDDTETQK